MSLTLIETMKDIEQSDKWNSTYQMAKSLKVGKSLIQTVIDYSHGTSAHAHEALRIHLHNLCAYKL